MLCLRASLRRAYLARIKERKNNNERNVLKALGRPSPYPYERTYFLNGRIANMLSKTHNIETIQFEHHSIKVKFDANGAFYRFIKNDDKYSFSI